jgi:hypothetical protein
VSPAAPHPTAEEVYEAAMAAYGRGDWLRARRLLRQAIETDPRKQQRVQAGKLLRALEVDRFALGLAALFLFILAILFAGLVFS